MKASLRRCTAVVVTIALASAPLTALAQAPRPPGGDPVAQASEHFQRGVRLYQEDDFRASLIEFNRAYELAPNWAVLYDIGQSQYQLREYPGALKTLEKYIKDGGSAIPADRRSQVDREIAELRGRVAHVTMTSNTEGADLTLDDAPLGHTPASEPFVIGAGRHKLSAAKVGFVTATKVVDIAGGDTLNVELDLIPETTAPATPESPPNYTPAIVSGAVGVAGIAVGTVFGIAAINDHSSLSKDCNTAKQCPGTSQSDINSYSTNGTLSTIGFGVGVVGIALGAYFFFHERAKGTTRAATFQPGVNGFSVSF
jgi:hypothetical protein